MKTLKKSVVQLDDGDQLEVQAGDLIISVAMGYSGIGHVRIDRPRTDGRYLEMEYGKPPEQGIAAGSEKSLVEGFIFVCPVEWKDGEPPENFFYQRRELR